jgi:hypothetical protein
MMAAPLAVAAPALAVLDPICTSHLEGATTVVEHGPVLSSTRKENGAVCGHLFHGDPQTPPSRHWRAGPLTWDFLSRTARPLLRAIFAATVPADENNVTIVIVNSNPAGVQIDAGRFTRFTRVSHWHGRIRGVHLRH